jgi:hypothetical protein
VKEEPEHGRPGDRRLHHGLLYGALDNGLQIGVGAGVVVDPQLSHGRQTIKVRHRLMILSLEVKLLKYT